MSAVMAANSTRDTLLWVTMSILITHSSGSLLKERGTKKGRARRSVVP